MGKIFTDITKYYQRLFLMYFFLGLQTSIAFAQCNTLVWQDEFEGTTLNTADWNYETGNGCQYGNDLCGWGNNELEYYTSGTNNIQVSGGNLIITAKNQNNYNGSGSNYTSGKIVTKGKHSWKYGRMEARIKVPSASAIWPAFWMLPDNGDWPKTGEIDILETQNKNPFVANQTLHFFCTPCGNHQYIGVGHNNGTNWSLDYHTYAVDWSEQQIQFSVDGVVTETYTPASLGVEGGLTTDWPFDDQNFYLILNLAVGGTYTGNATPVAAEYPVSMLVDYVRVYSTPSSLVITGDDKVFVGDQATYSVVNGGAGTTYNWTVPAGATITSGSNTNQITVQWNSGTGGNVSVSVDPDGAGACVASSVSLPVQVSQVVCHTDPQVSCIFEDNFDDNIANWITTTTFTHSESNDTWKVDNDGHDEWNTFTYKFNNGSSATPIDFSCTGNKPILKIKAKASGNALLRVGLMDENGRSTDGQNDYNLELTTTYKTFTIDYSKRFRNYHSSSPGLLDSTSIDRIQFFINPGYYSYPVNGTNAFYNSPFTGTVEIDWIGLGENCPYSIPTAITNANSNETIEVKPNPFTGATIIRINSVNATQVALRVVDVNGQTVLNTDVYTTNSDIKIGEQIPAGIYSVIADFNGQFKIFKIVKVQ